MARSSCIRKRRYAKALAASVVAYALSPIDLIPDFVPVIGYLDDLILVPLGIMLTVKLIPAELMVEFRQQAAAINAKPKSYIGAGVIVMVWIIAMALAGWWLWPFVTGYIAN